MRAAGLVCAALGAYAWPVVEPLVVLEDPDFLVVAKPAGMHTAPLRPDEPGTLLAWVLGRHPEVGRVPGLKPIEPGLLHRLDRDTSGLVLLARTAAAWQALQTAASGGRFVKRYRALVTAAASPPQGTRELLMGPVEPATAVLPLLIESAFRAWGPGRSRVAAVPQAPAEGRRLYSTRLLELEPGEGGAPPQPRYRALVELATGYRHQVRVHLAAIGLPILGDSLYGDPGASEAGRLFLHACGLEFPHPSSGRLVVAAHEGF